MKLFLRKLFLFLILAFGVLALSYYSTLLYLQNKNYYKVPENIHSIILGHSQPACAFNDEIIIGFYNLAQFTEGYPYSYYKAKLILENNKSIRNIFVEYTNNQIGYWAKERVFGSYMSLNMERMLPFLDMSFTLKMFCASKSITQISNSLFKSYRTNLDFILSNKSNFIEEYWHNHKAPDHKFAGDTTKKIKNQTNFVNYLSIQEENIRYLYLLKQLCKRHKVNFFLVRSPLPKYIREGETNEAFLRLVRETYFSDVPFLDFSSYPLSLDYFADNSHLNIEGSKKFSMYFNDSIVNQVSFSNKEIEGIVIDKLKRLK